MCVCVCVVTDIVCCNFVSLLFVFLLSAHLGKNSEDNWFDFLSLSLFLSFLSLYCYWYGYVLLNFCGCVHFNFEHFNAFYYCYTARF